MKFLLIILIASAANAFTPETLTFKVTVDVDYRCYGLKGVCDGKNYKKTLFNKTVKITIKSEDTPDGPQYVGDWIDKQTFKGRNFEYALTVFKEFPKKGKPYYTVRAVLAENEENRSTSTTLKAFSPKEFNPITIDRNSKGEPEITSKMTVEIEKQ